MPKREPLMARSIGPLTSNPTPTLTLKMTHDLTEAPWLPVRVSSCLFSPTLKHSSLWLTSDYFAEEEEESGIRRKEEKRLSYSSIRTISLSCNHQVQQKASKKK